MTTQISLLERIRGVAGQPPRIETDLGDPELQRMIDNANQEVIRRYGPHADPDNPITIRVDGGGVTIDLLRPIDTTYPNDDYPDAGPVVVEHWQSVPLSTPQSRTLDLDTDFRVWAGGRFLERLATSDSSLWSRDWGNVASASRFAWGGSSGYVDITYVPVNDGDQREEAIIQLVRLAIDYRPVTREQIGDVQVFPSDYRLERERILGTLQPRRGLLLR